MASTTYTVFAGDVAQEKTFSKKDKAIEAAETLRKELKVSVRVETGAGTEVFASKARKAQVKTVPYTRTVELPEGFIVPEGLRPAYTRARKNLVILHDPNGGEEGEGAYSVHNGATGETLISGLATTRDSGAFCKTVPLPEKVNA
jgi:hypothetical protein